MLKNFLSHSRHLQPPVGSRILHEFDIPGILSSEDELAKMAEKKGFSIFFQIREGAERPVVRILRKVEPFTDVFAADDLRKKMDRTLKTMNIPCSRAHTAILIPTPVEEDITYTRSILAGTRRVSITGTFDRLDHHSFLTSDIIPTAALTRPSDDHEIHVYRDKIDKDNVWKIRYSAFPDYTGVNLSTPQRSFIKFIKEQLNARDIHLRLIL